MIGRFSNLGSYKELFLTKDFLRVGIAGMLALVGFFLDKGNEGYSTIGLILILISVGVNGVPIMGAIVHNVGSVLVVLSSASLGFTSNKA